MQITNSLIPTLSQADSPSQLSDGTPQAKNAKKKGQTDSSSFDSSMDAVLMSLIASAQAANPEPATTQELGGQTNADLISKLGEQAATKVELSTKNVSKNQETGAPAPTIASLFQVKAQQNANGTMADAFVAGPDRPWGSKWVFGGNQPSMEDMNATQNSKGQLEGPLSLESLKKFVEKAKAQAQGGDESQLKQAGESAATDLAAVQELVKQFGGEIESVQTDSAQNSDSGKSTKSALGLVSGGDYLSTMNAAKAPTGNFSAENGNSGFGSETGSGGESGFAAPQAQVGAHAKSKLSSGSRPELQVIPGGISGGSQSGRLEGGLRSSKEELKPAPYETVFMAPTAAPRGNDSMGPVPPQTITGHVVPGAMMKDRLTNESLRNVSNGIQGMSANGGGEMRIKMNPGNLGELMIRVSTNGKDVGLKVQASDSNAKKILEESIGSLRDSLAQQSLALGRVDVVIASNPSQDMGNSSTGQHGSPAHQMSQQMADGQSGASQNGRQWGNEDSSSVPGRGIAQNSSSRSTANAAASWARSGNAARAADSRLDVMA